MDSFHSGARPERRGRYLNVVLTANAVLLGLAVVGNAPALRSPWSPVESAALAAPPTEESEVSGRVNPAEQRKQIIAELQSIASKMSALEARLKGPLTVKVVEMPKDNSKDAKDAQKPSK